MSVLESFSLKGKVALLTGSAGLYGRQMLQALAEAGARVYTGSRNLDALEKQAEDYRSRGFDVRALRLDQSIEAEVLAARDTILKESGKIDVLVNNAVYRPVADVHDDISKFDESMKVNATGLFSISRTFADVMAEAGGGSIINIGSIFGMLGPDVSVYEDTDLVWARPDYYFEKGGMITLTKFIAGYYGIKGVRCNCISPGGFWTEDMHPVFVERYKKSTCLRRMANSTDLVGIIVFLASDASAYITGANIPVDGGRTAI